MRQALLQTRLAQQTGQLIQLKRKTVNYLSKHRIKGNKRAREDRKERRGGSGPAPFWGLGRVDRGRGRKNGKRGLVCGGESSVREIRERNDDALQIF